MSHKVQHFHLNWFLFCHQIDSLVDNTGDWRNWWHSSYWKWEEQKIIISNEGHFRILLSYFLSSSTGNYNLVQVKFLLSKSWFCVSAASKVANTVTKIIQNQVHYWKLMIDFWHDTDQQIFIHLVIKIDTVDNNTENDKFNCNLKLLVTV